MSPIPQRHAAPTKSRRVTPSGATAKRAAMARPEASKMPSGFPSTRPKTTPAKIPGASGDVNSVVTRTPVAENANTGRITYALQGARARSMRSAGERNRALAAERLRAAHSQIGSRSSRDSSRPSRRASLSACSNAASAVAA